MIVTSVWRQSVRIIFESVARNEWDEILERTEITSHETQMTIGNPNKKSIALIRNNKQ